MPWTTGDASCAVACPRCDYPLDHEQTHTGPQTCPHCQREFEAVRFDPPQIRQYLRAVAEVGQEGATACANHPGNTAVASCERCGILMCALCRIESDRMALCPACFERLSDEGALRSTQVAYRDYSRMATTLVVLGIPFFFVGVLTGTAAIYCGVKGLAQTRARGESESALRWFFVFLGAPLEMAGNILFLVSIFRAP